MQLTDGTGTVKAAYTYGTYGELLSGDSSLTRYLYNGRCGVSTDANGLYYMRQRYYNPEIKRFVNQDVVRGSIGNSRSLNRYSYVQGNPVSYTDPFGLSPISGLFADTSFAHSVLGLLGCIPGPVGILANSADAILYFAVDHDYLMATVSALDAVSMGATGKIAKAVGKGQKIPKSAMYLKVTTSLLSNTLSFAKNTSMAGENLHKMYNKYIAEGHTFDWNDSETRAECYNLCLNLFGMALSGSGMSRDTSKLSRMLEADGVERALRNKISNVLSGGRKSGSNTKTLFRGDRASVVPDDVFQNGFKPKGTHNDALLHTKSNTTAGNFVSTSGDKTIATEFAGKNGYVYVIQTDNYVDINSTYGAGAYFPEQMEFSIPGGIKPSEIVGAYKKQGGKIIGDFIPNPNFGGN